LVHADRALSPAEELVLAVELLAAEEEMAHGLRHVLPAV
jgi:hypothetical protein